MSLPTAAQFRASRAAYVQSEAALTVERALFAAFLEANPAALKYTREIHRDLSLRLAEELKPLGWYGDHVQGKFQLTL